MIYRCWLDPILDTLVSFLFSKCCCYGLRSECRHTPKTTSGPSLWAHFTHKDWPGLGLGSCTSRGGSSPCSEGWLPAVERAAMTGFLGSFISASLSAGMVAATWGSRRSPCLCVCGIPCLPARSRSMELTGRKKKKKKEEKKKTPNPAWSQH